MICTLNFKSSIINGVHILLPTTRIISGTLMFSTWVVQNNYCFDNYCQLLYLIVSFNISISYPI